MMGINAPGRYPAAMLTSRKISLIVVGTVIVALAGVIASLGYRKHQEKVDHTKQLSLVSSGIGSVGSVNRGGGV